MIWGYVVLGAFLCTMWQNCCITCNRWHGRIIVCRWSTLEYQPLIYRPGSAWFFIIAKTPRLPAEHLPSSSSVNAMRARCIGSLSFFFFFVGGFMWVWLAWISWLWNAGRTYERKNKVKKIYPNLGDLMERWSAWPNRMRWVVGAR